MDFGMRLFVAITVPEEVKRSLHTLQARIRAQIGPDEGRWCMPNQMHLTILFFGEATPESVPNLLRELEHVCRNTQPFSVTATGLGCFPPRRPPRVLWVGLVSPRGDLDQLHESIAHATASFAKEPSEDQFQAHVTLARFRSVHPHTADLLAKICAESLSQIYGSWTVPELELIRSELSPAGSHYTTLARLTFAHDAKSGSA
jgi:2'-5' RNA ligase